MRKPSFFSSLRVLLWKTFLIKFRTFSSIVEYISSLLLFHILYYVHREARYEWKGSVNPGLSTLTLFDSSIIKFFATYPNPIFVVYPENNNTHALFDPIVSIIRDNVSIIYEFVNTSEELSNRVYQNAINGMGIAWNNSQDIDCWENPKISLYHQSFHGNPGSGMFRIIRSFIAKQTKKLALLSLDTKRQKYAMPTITELYDTRTVVSFFCVLPIILASSDDFQTILNEKSTRLAALLFLTGCTEKVYWVCSYISTFLSCIIPSIALSFSFSRLYLLIGTDFSLLLVITMLFAMAHIIFQMFLTTFVKNAKNGRMITILLLVFVFATGFLHAFVTLDPDNHGVYLKHISSLVPFSAYQLVIMAIQQQTRDSLPSITWDNMDLIQYAVFWLLVDIIIYALLFIVSNSILKREFGSPPVETVGVFPGSNDSLALQDVEDKLVSVYDVSKTYYGFREVNALSKVNFQINHGEIIVLVGPNGAGKSTLMNILSGTLIPSTGCLSINGGNYTRSFKKMRDILGVCFQENVYFDQLSVKEHFELFGVFRGMKDPEIIEAIDLFTQNMQLVDSMNNRAESLSGGQKRKLCISLSLLGSPKLVIMDEPTAGVDAQSRKLIWKMISSLKDTAAIITSHALEEAEAVSSRLFIVSSGKLTFQGTSTDLRRQLGCGYIFRFDGPETAIHGINDIADQIIGEKLRKTEKKNTYTISISPKIPYFLKEIKSKQETLGIDSICLSVEQLEDVIIKLILSDESAFQSNPNQ